MPKDSGGLGRQIPMGYPMPVARGSPKGYIRHYRTGGAQTLGLPWAGHLKTPLAEAEGC